MARTILPDYSGPITDDLDLTMLKDELVEWARIAQGDADKADEVENAAYYEGLVEVLLYVLDKLTGKQIPRSSMPKYFQMDPAEDDLMIDGEGLMNGMVVLIAEDDHRQELMWGNQDPERYSRFAQFNYWCRVTELRRDGSLLSFVGVYSDGVKRKFSVTNRPGWYFKKNILTNPL